MTEYLFAFDKFDLEITRMKTFMAKYLFFVISVGD